MNEEIKEILEQLKDREETYDYINPKTGGIKHYPKWMMDALKSKTPEERSRLRSKTFKGIAEAMATQWEVIVNDK